MMNETTETQYGIFGPASIGILATASTGASLLTISGNVLVVTSFIVERSLRTPTNYFIASLAVTDLLIGLLSMNVYTAYVLLGYWPMSQLLCDLWLALDFSACLTSQYNVLLITVDRYCSVRMAVKYRQWRTENKVRLLVCATWVIPCAVFYTSIVGWPYFAGGRSRSRKHCNVEFQQDLVFISVLTIAYFWIPLMLMITLYVGIYRVALNLQRRSANRKLHLNGIVSIAGRTMMGIGMGIARRTDDPQQAYNGTRLIRRPNELSAELRCHVGQRSRDNDSFSIDSDHESITDSKKYGVSNKLHKQKLILEPQDIRHSGINSSSGNVRKDDPLPKIVVSTPTFSAVVVNNFGSTSVPQTATTYLSQYNSLTLTSGGDKVPESVSSASMTNSSDKESNSLEEYFNSLAIDFIDGAVDDVSSPIGFTTEKQEDKASEILPLLPHTTEESDIHVRESNFNLGRNNCGFGAQSEWNLHKIRFHTHNLSRRVSFAAPVTDFAKRIVAMRSKFQLRPRKSNTEHRARKALRTITIILGAFVLCWTPYHVLIFVQGICAECVNVHIANIAYWLCYLNSPINPFCYALANVQFKRTFNRILSCRCKYNHQSAV